jgi:hypothetical protein
MNKSETHSFRAELKFRTYLNDAMRAILLRYLPKLRPLPYRIRLMPVRRKTDDPPLGPVWFSVERRVAFVLWREIGACRFGDLNTAELFIREDIVRRRANRFRPTVVARADEAGKVLTCR